MSREDVDDLLEWYLEGLTVDTVAKADCEKKHDTLETDVEKAILAANGRSESRLKLWILGGLLAGVIAGLGGYTCSVTEIGAYKERIDNTTKQIEEMKGELRDLRGEIRTIRELLLRKEGP